MGRVVSSSEDMVRSSSSATSCPDGLSCVWRTNLDDIAAEWDELAQASPTRHPHYLLDWLQPWWSCVGSKRHSLRVALVFEGERTTAIAPLMLVERRTHRLATIRELQWLAMGDTDQSDVLCATDQARAGAAVAHHLVRHQGAWDELHLSSVPEGSQAVGSLIEVLRAGLKCEVTIRRHRCLYIDAGGGDWDAHLQSTSRKFREDLRRIRRRLEDMGELAISQSTTVDLDEFLRLATALHGVRQQELGRETRLATVEFGSFVREALERLQNRGMLLVWTLHVGDTVAAYNLGFRMGSVVYGWNMAHDPAYSSASPGKVLLASAIESCFVDESVGEFNLMRGDTDYKRKWTSTHRDLLDIRVRNFSTPRSALVNSLRRRAH
jgi:CelD/BcsL family acetyltransferase involved in cellulose biosynthesis